MLLKKCGSHFVRLKLTAEFDNFLAFFNFPKQAPKFEPYITLHVEKNHDHLTTSKVKKKRENTSIRPHEKKNLLIDFQGAKWMLF